MHVRFDALRPTCSVRRLRAIMASREIFGYPGGQLTPIYDAIYREPAVRHVLARDEQAVGFMADGYARATGRPGVGLAVCGPGVLNATTPLATSFTDSVPVLLITGQVPRSRVGATVGLLPRKRPALRLRHVHQENLSRRADGPAFASVGRRVDAAHGWPTRPDFVRDPDRRIADGVRTVQLAGPARRCHARGASA